MMDTSTSPSPNARSLRCPLLDQSNAEEPSHGCCRAFKRIRLCFSSCITSVCKTAGKVTEAVNQFFDTTLGNTVLITAYAGGITASAIYDVEASYYVCCALAGYSVQNLCILRHMPKQVEEPQDLERTGSIQDIKSVTLEEEKAAESKHCGDRTLDTMTGGVLKVQALYAHPINRLTAMLYPISSKASLTMACSTLGMFIRIKMTTLRASLKATPAAPAVEETEDDKTTLSKCDKISRVFSLYGRHMFDVALGGSIILIFSYSTDGLVRRIGIDVGTAFIFKPIGYFALKKIEKKIEKSKGSKVQKLMRFFLQNTAFPIAAGIAIYRFSYPFIGMGFIGFADGCKNWMFENTPPDELTQDLSEEGLSTCKKVKLFIRNNWGQLLCVGYLVYDILAPTSKQGTCVFASGLFIYIGRKKSRTGEISQYRVVKWISKKFILITEKYHQEMIWLSIYAYFNPIPYPLQIPGLILLGMSVGVSQEDAFRQQKGIAAPNFSRPGDLARFRFR